MRNHFSAASATPGFAVQDGSDLLCHLVNHSLKESNRQVFPLTFLMQKSWQFDEQKLDRLPLLSYANVSNYKRRKEVISINPISDHLAQNCEPECSVTISLNK